MREYGKRGCPAPNVAVFRPAVSDVALFWQINIFGDPALTLEQFRSFVPQTFSSFHHIGTPLGTYNPNLAD